MVMVLIFTWILAINSIAILCFYIDKKQAVSGGNRIRESDLLSLAMLGGSPGALLARRMFRHKTRKEPFSTWLMLIVAVQIGAGGTLLLLEVA